MNRPKAIIVGAGIAGIATAIRLRRQGFTVSVYEANAYAGGKLSQIELNGYRFDGGPSLFTLPHLVDELFELCGENPRQHFQYRALPQICNYFYDDGTRFTAHASRSTFNEALQAVATPNERRAFFKQLDLAARRYQLTAPLFIEQSLHRIKNYLNWRTVKGLLNAHQLNPFQSMNTENQHRVQNPYLTQYLNRYATYNGSDPYRAPALLNMIPHLEHDLGSYFPEGGLFSIPKSLHQLALSQGVEFHFQQPVQEIATERGTVHGIRVKHPDSGEKTFIPADVVVSNADIYTTYKRLLPKLPSPEKILSQERSTSALVFYWGIRAQFPELHLHNIFFSRDYKAEFEQLFKGREPYQDPTVYINITSKCSSGDAPEGCENWFVMINVPHHQGQDWAELTRVCREQILQKLSSVLGRDIASLIEAETTLDPLKIETLTSSHGGSLYGTASNNRFAAFLRHKNFSSEVKGLYFCGGSVHPGGGIPLCLNSAKIVSSMVAEDL